MMQVTKQLNNLCTSVAPGGYLLIAVPNVFSLKGIVTRFTPHGFHIWYYRNILNTKSAGEPDRAPFKAFLHSRLSSTKLKEQLLKNGFEVEKVIFNDVMVHQLKKSHFPLWVSYAALAMLLKCVSFGKYGGMHNSDFVITAKKDSAR